MGPGPERERSLIADVHAPRAVNALVVAHAADVHIACGHTGSAAVAALLVHLDADQSQLVKKAVDRAERTDKAAERAETEDAAEPDEQQDHKFAREEDVQHREVTGIFRVGQKPHCAFKSSRGTYVFAKARDRKVLFDAVPHRNSHDENCKDHVFEISERMRKAALSDLGRGDLVEQFLHKAQRAQPAADRPAQGQAEDHDDAQDVPSHAVSGIGQRILNRAQRTGADSAGTGIAIEAGYADSFGFALVNLSVYEAPQMRIVKQGRIELDQFSLEGPEILPPVAGISGFCTGFVFHCIIQDLHTPYRF